MKKKRKLFCSNEFKVDNRVNNMNEKQELRREEPMVIMLGQQSFLNVRSEAGADIPIPEERSNTVMQHASNRKEACEAGHQKTFLKQQ